MLTAYRREGRRKRIVRAPTFATRVEGNPLDYNIPDETLRIARQGVLRTFWKEQHRFNMADDNTEERELRRIRLKKLRLIAKAFNKILKIKK